MNSLPFFYILLTTLPLSLFLLYARFVCLFFPLSLSLCANHKNINIITIPIFRSSSVYLWFDEFIYSQTVPWFLIDENNIIGPTLSGSIASENKGLFFFEATILNGKWRGRWKDIQNKHANIPHFSCTLFFLAVLIRYLTIILYNQNCLEFGLSKWFKVVNGLK